MLFVAERYVGQSQSGPIRELHGLALLLDRRLLQFHQSFASREGTDDDGDELRHIAEGTLNLAYQLDEGQHHAVGDAALVEAGHAPDECDEVACGKAGADEHARERREYGAMADLLAQVLLCMVEALGHGTGTLQRLQDDAVLDALLQDALYAALGVAHIASDGTHLAHIEFADDHEHGHDADDEQGQFGIHRVEEEEGSDESRRDAESRGQRLGDDVGDILHVANQAVQHVAAVA